MIGARRVLLSGGRFTPLFFSPALWLDSSDASTLFQDAALTVPVTADGDVVGGWRDKSGNNRHATQATTSKKPTRQAISGRRYCRFDGTDDWLSITLSTPIVQPDTIFVVGARRSGTNQQHFIDGGPTGGRQALYVTTAAIYALFITSNLPGGAATTADALLSVIANGASSALRVNGSASTANPGTGSLDNVTIGAAQLQNTNFLNGDVAEIVIVPRALTTPEIVQMESYLRTKWGTP